MILEELRNIAAKYKLHFFAIWGIEGGNGWIWYKQDDEKNFKIQIFTHENFEIYKSIKSDIINLFLSCGCSIANEEDLGNNFGFRKNLYFMDTTELQNKIIEKEKFLKSMQAPTYNIGQINADGSIITLGNVIGSSQNIDNSVHQIEYLIEEKGGEDKNELYSILNEAKEIIDGMAKTKEVKPNKGFIKKLGVHLAKHGWFYGAIVTLLGTALIAILGLSGK